LKTPLKAYLGGILRDLRSPLIVAEVVRDHGHLLYRQSKNLSVAKVVEEVKKSSSKWMKKSPQSIAGFQWQAGYGVFSVSASRLDSVVRYIQGQEEHHRTVMYQEELRRFLDEYGIEYDERYVWD
jgi:putative transposase